MCVEQKNYKVCIFPTKLNFVELCSLYKRLEYFCKCRMLDFFFPTINSSTILGQGNCNVIQNI